MSPFQIPPAYKAYPRNDPGKTFSEGMRVVRGDEAPLGGVAQVILHGVPVVEVGLQVREHEEGEKEKDWEVQVEVERERSKRIKRCNTCATCGWSDGLNELEPKGS